MAVAAPVDTTSMCGWQYAKSLKDCVHHMLINELATDVCFRVGPPEGSSGAVSEVRAHKFILMCRSAVFEKLLADQPTSVTDRDGIRITGMEPVVFKELLTYIYTDDATVTSDNALHLICAAKRYLLPGLLQLCRTFLQASLTVDNVCTMMDKSLELGETELKEQCVKQICNKVNEVIKTEVFLALTPNALEILVGDDDFQPGADEYDVHTACVTWATSQLQKQSAVNDPTDQQLREMLGPILYRIRYPTLSLERFVSTLKNSRVLLDLEKLSVFNFLVSEEKDDSLVFDSEPRNASHNQAGTVDRFAAVALCRNLYGNRCYIFDPSGSGVDAIQFTTNKDVVLVGVGLFPCHDLSPDFGMKQETSVNIQLNGIDISRTTATVTQEVNQIKVDMEKPVKIKSGYVYTVWMPAYVYRTLGTNGRAQWSGQGVTFTFSNSPLSTSGRTTVEHGQLPHLFFKCKKE